MSELKSNSYNIHSIFIVKSYRLANFCYRCIKVNKINLIWAVWILVLYRFMNEFIFGYEIPYSTQIAKPLIIHHGYGVVINKNVIIGKNCQLRHGVTIGNKSESDLRAPIIGDNVDIGAGVFIIGNIEIGNNVRIGAGAIVVDSIPDNSTFVAPKSRCI